MWSELRKVAQQVEKEPWQMTKEEFDRTAMAVGSNLKERWNRVVAVDDDDRLPNVYKVIPKYKWTSIIKQVLEGGLKTVTVYRGVPRDMDIKEIRPGDWVALDRRFAKSGKVMSKVVPVEDVVWAGTDENEFFYAPVSYSDIQSFTTHRSLVQRAIKDGLPVPKEVLKDYPDLQA